MMNTSLFTHNNHPATLVELLRLRALQQRDQQAFAFLLNGEDSEHSLTYGELDRRARAIGSVLQRQIPPGERVLLLYAPGLEYIAAFFGCLYAGVIAVPSYLPQRNRSSSRIQSIASDAQARVALSTSQLIADIHGRFVHTPVLATLEWIESDTIAEQEAQQWQPPAINGKTVAMLQYTSGSTAQPKGVILSHANLLHNLSLIQHCFEHTANSRGVIWLPPYHDMGLIGGILQPLYAGFPVTLMSPVSFLQRPLRWLEAIARMQATTSGGPNFAYDLCIRKSTPEQRAALDLRSWKVAFTGAEPVKAATLEQFAEAFRVSGFRYEAFYPCYGLAEATLLVSGDSVSAPPFAESFDIAQLQRHRAVQAAGPAAEIRTLVSCGRASDDQQIMIVDSDMATPCQEGQVGEIWIAGPSVAQGYWNQPETSRRTFQAVLAGDDTRRFLRSGDLGFMRQGNLFITGRLKDLIIIRGRNYYPEDIEITAQQSHSGLRPYGGAAFTIEVADEERLVVVQEIERQARQIPADTLIQEIRASVMQEHQLQVHTVVLIKPGSIPKTSSGKIQRHACRERLLEGTLDIISSSTLNGSAEFADVAASPRGIDRELLAGVSEAEQYRLLEAYLVQRAAQVLHLEPSEMTIQRPLSAFGLDSLMAIELQHAIEVDLGVIIPMANIVEGPTVAQLAKQIVNTLADGAVRVEARLEHHSMHSAVAPLSHGQQALWFLHQLAPQSAAYNVAYVVRSVQHLDHTALQQAFDQLVSRHSALRTVFTVQDGQPVQHIQQHITGYIRYVEATKWSEAELQQRLVAAAHEPFDLRSGPLLRLHVYARSPREHLVLFTLHHSITDFWSLAVLMQELGVVYTAICNREAVVLPPLPLHYGDYARRQQEWLASPEAESDWLYWQQQLRPEGARELPVLHLPTDRPRPAVQTYNGRCQRMTIEAALTEQIKALGRAEGTTLYTTLLTAFEVLLYRYTGQTDILVGTLTMGRNRAELAPLVGYFSNPLVHRARPQPDLPFTAFLGQVRQTILDAFEHQRFPFNTLVERLQPERDLSRTPLFQVMFVLQKAPLLHEHNLTAFAMDESGTQIQLGQLHLECVALERNIAQFDLALRMAEVDDRLVASVEYNTDLFDEATIRRLLDHFHTLLAGIVAAPTELLANLPLLPDTEQQLLRSWNQTAVPYPHSLCVHQLFEAQVERTPDALAVLYRDEQLTYRQLNQRANQLAHRLRRLGVGCDDLIALCVEPFLDMVVGVLGILKAGGAYVPLDPTYPQERLALILDDIQARVMVTQQQFVSLIPQQEIIPICLDTDWASIAQEPESNPGGPMSADQIAFVMYTSGSTGKPKGVLLTHQGTVNHCLAAAQWYGLQPTDRMMQFSSISFDNSVEEMFATWFSGGTLVLRTSGVIATPQEFLQLVESAGITVLNLPTAYWHELVDGIARLKRVLPASIRLTKVGGDRASTERLAVWRQHGGGSIPWINGYGPTEITVGTTFFELAPHNDLPWSSPPIGRPHNNRQIHVLDAQLRPVPIGVVGEVHIGGAGLARGYLNNSGATAEKFVPDPFSHPQDARPGARLYKTGDLARWLPDGNIEFIGRRDHQVKIRGFRVEPGEVEAALARYAAVRESVVMVSTDRSGSNRLIAYVVFHNQAAPPIAELRRFLRERLPEYMVPSVFIPINAIPLTPSGKLDRAALPKPEQISLDSGVPYVAPRSKIEEIISTVWQEVLDLKQVSVQANFFDLGGHSLSIIRVHNQLQERLQQTVSVVELFEHPTIRSLAEHLSQQQSTPASFQQTLDRVEQQKQAIMRQQQARRRRNHE
jgi:amino acid adenylation domain-containing protein